ncbi:hypothetical protein GGR54DRAFT_190643 [Hypoxylon sp. NC1633]|nr:hypothetical protein GGR54DRAFT_190643 [Hypoxylon sp. NC1633]
MASTELKGELMTLERLRERKERQIHEAERAFVDVREALRAAADWGNVVKDSMLPSGIELQMGTYFTKNFQRSVATARMAVTRASNAIRTIIILPKLEPYEVTGPEQLGGPFITLPQTAKRFKAEIKKHKRRLGRWEKLAAGDSTVDVKDDDDEVMGDDLGGVGDDAPRYEGGFVVTGETDEAEMDESEYERDEDDYDSEGNSYRTEFSMVEAARRRWQSRPPPDPEEAEELPEIGEEDSAPVETERGYLPKRSDKKEDSAVGPSTDLNTEDEVDHSMFSLSLPLLFKYRGGHARRLAKRAPAPPNY